MTTSRAPARSSSDRSRWSTPGSGTFLEKDEAARRFVIEAKGKDKRGNGTAGATVTATFAEEGPDCTRVDVNTDLAITGKPAQFGRGVIEDISNKLLQQFVTCLQDKVGAPASAAEEPVAEAAATTGSAPQADPGPVTASTVPPQPAAGLLHGPASRRRPRGRPRRATTRWTSGPRCCRSWRRPTAPRSGSRWSP